MMNTRLDGVLLRQKRNRLLDAAFGAMVALGVSLGAAGFAERARAVSAETTADTAERSAARTTLDQLAERERMGG
jgi:hypothetical protein